MAQEDQRVFSEEVKEQPECHHGGGNDEGDGCSDEGDDDAATHQDGVVDPKALGISLNSVESVG